MENLILKVSSKSNPNCVAGMIAAMVKDDKMKRIEMQSVGAGAINQAIKSIAIARGFLAPSGIDLVCIPAFNVINIDGDNRTAIKLILEVRY